MKKSVRLQPIVEMADTRQQRATAALGQAQYHLRQQESRLEELRQYYQEYLLRMHSVGSGGSGAAMLLSIKEFTEKLHTAIQAQEQQVRDAESMLQNKKLNWFESRRNKKTLLKVVDSYSKQEQRNEAVKEQKDNDERSLRFFTPKNDEVA
ncbi:MAG: flagellar export protein FliJ [Gammaproteobacteria bacterium]|nr:flagellar export protein FliJ [Gammaproteobacteria bacterium]MDH5802660.1 flagellar export protein FliJ [Gammaproteobacteria bacterium]